MQDHPNSPYAHGVGRDGTRAHDIQRDVLLDVILEATPDGDEIAFPGQGLGYTREEIDAAVEVLAAVGLVERRDDRALASTATLAFDALLPVAV